MLRYLLAIVGTVAVSACVADELPVSLLRGTPVHRVLNGAHQPDEPLSVTVSRLEYRRRISLAGIGGDDRVGDLMEAGLSQASAELVQSIFQRYSTESRRRGQLVQLVNEVTDGKPSVDERRKVVIETEKELDAIEDEITHELLKKLNDKEMDILVGKQLAHGPAQWAHPLCVRRLKLTPQQLRAIDTKQRKVRSLIDGAIEEAAKKKVQVSSLLPEMPEYLAANVSFLGIFDKEQLDDYLTLTKITTPVQTRVKWLASLSPKYRTLYKEHVPLLKDDIEKVSN